MPHNKYFNFEITHHYFSNVYEYFAENITLNFYYEERSQRNQF